MVGSEVGEDDDLVSAEQGQEGIAQVKVCLEIRILNVVWKFVPLMC